MRATRPRPVNRSVRKLGPTLIAVGCFGAAKAEAAATTDIAPRFSRRITTDMGWFGGYGHARQASRFDVRESTSKRSAYGELDMSGAGFGQGLFVNGTVRIIRKFAVGAEAWYYRNSFALESPLADGLQIQYAHRDYLGLSIAIEYIPFATDYSPRQGWFLQGSIGPYANFDHVRSGGYRVDSPALGTLLQMTTCGGFRVPVESLFSLSLAMFFRLESGATAGLRIAGGFQ